MSARSWSLLSALCAALVAAPCRATGAEVLTLERALSIAEEQNRDIQKSEEYQNWIRGRYEEERAQALPQVTLGASYRREYDETYALFTGGLFPKSQDTTTYEIGLKQTLFHWGRVAAAIRGASIGVDIGKEQLRFYRQGARRGVSEAFHDVVLAEELLAISTENLKQKERHLEEARKKFDIGTVTDYDVLAAEVDTANARPAVIRAENGIRTAKKRLLFHLGREEGEIEIEGTLEAAEEELPDYADAVRDALARRPELTQQRLLIQGYEQVLTIERAGLRPRLDLAAAYAEKSLAAEGLEIRPATWSAALVLIFPVFDGFRTQGKVRQARSDLDAARIEEAKLRDAVTLQVRTALDAAREAAEILKALQGTVQQAERLLDMAEKGFEFGVKTRLDVDDAQLNLIQARANRARAQRDYVVALTDLEWVRGVIGETIATGRDAGGRGYASAR